MATASSRWLISAACSIAWPRPTARTWSLGYRLKRADPFIRTAYARAYRLALQHLLSARCSRRRLCLQALQAREPGGHPPRIGRRVHVRRAADQAQAARPTDRRGRRAALPAHGRVGHRCQTSVIFRAVRDFWRLRIRLWTNRAAALKQGEPVGRAGRPLSRVGGRPRRAHRADPG